MLRIRLQRRGKNKYATYRVVVADQHAPVKGKFTEDLGWYNPHTNEFKVKKDRIQDRIKQGAQPSNTIHNLLVTAGIIQAEKVTSWRPKKKAGEEAKAATQPAAEGATDQKPAV